MKFWTLALVAATAVAQDSPERLSLTEAEQIALGNNPRIRAAEAQALASTQVRPQIRAAMYPVLTGNVSGVGAPSDTRIAAGAINNPAIFSRFASGVTASQMITDFGRTSALARSAELRANAEFETHKATRADVLLAVNRAYYAGLRSQAVLDIAQRTVIARQAIADHARALAASQLKSELDVRFAEVSLAEAKLLVENALNERRAADAELSMALGYTTVRTFQLVAEPARELPSTDPLKLTAQAVSRRPELAGRRFDVEAAQQLVEAERKLRFPSVSAVASFGAIPVYAEELGNNHYAAAGINISLPFLNGGLFAARQAEARYKAQAAQRRLDETTQRIARDVTVAVIAAQSAAQRMALSTQLVEQASLALDLAQARYELGLSSIVELSQAQIARTNAEVQKSVAEFDYQLQRALVGYHIGEMQ
jgi:outer membrane protein